VRKIQSEILISDGMAQGVAKIGPEKCGARKYTAIWDTGATSSAITRRVVNELLLPVVSRGISNTAAGSVETTGHVTHLWLPHGIIVMNCIATCVDLGAIDADVLIGMDVIGKGDFSISNFDGKTIMSFREPSMGHVDYTQKIGMTRIDPFLK
jgi:hypothetical protein